MNRWVGPAVAVVLLVFSAGAAAGQDGVAPLSSSLVALGGAFEAGWRSRVLPRLAGDTYLVGRGGLVLHTRLAVDETPGTVQLMLEVGATGAEQEREELHWQRDGGVMLWRTSNRRGPSATATAGALLRPVNARYLATEWRTPDVDARVEVTQRWIDAAPVPFVLLVFAVAPLAAADDSQRPLSVVMAEGLGRPDREERPWTETASVVRDAPDRLVGALRSAVIHMPNGTEVTVRVSVDEWRIVSMVLSGEDEFHSATREEIERAFGAPR